MSFMETREGRRAAQRTSPEARHYMDDVHDGWRVVGPRHGGFSDRCGLVAHRGVLHPDEYVDELRLLIEVERQLGFTISEVWEAYCQGRKSAATRELRARIDARLLAVADAGGNMTALARILEVDTKTIGRALARARAFAVSATWRQRITASGRT
jgi:hypothetical protein